MSNQLIAESRDKLHYRGDQTNFYPAHLMGPDMFGAYYRAAAAEYDQAADRTTLTLLPVAPDDLPRLAMAELQHLPSAARIHELFNGPVAA